MLSLLRHILHHNYSPLNTITISKQNLINNYQYLSQIDPKIKVAPVLKSNAYGHGINLVAKVLDNQGAPFFCTDSIYEAYQLLKLKLKTPLLIMGYVNPDNLKIKKLPFSYCVYDLELAKVLDKYQPGSEIHIFVDTGMNREGIKVADLPRFLNELKLLKNIKITGLMTHLACADNPKSSVTKSQLENFEVARKVCQRTNLEIKWFHLGGSMSLLSLPNLQCNLIRAGKVIYGAGDFIDQIKPALKLTTQIIQVKEISKGQRVGYNETFTAGKHLRTAVLPIGYNDGVDRRLSNKGVMTINGVECPIIGLISMNLTTIDVSNVPDVQAGQEVVVFSDIQSDPNSINNAAKRCETIPLELLIHLNPTTRRIIS